MSPKEIAGVAVVSLLAVAAASRVPSLRGLVLPPVEASARSVIEDFRAILRIPEPVREGASGFIQWFQDRIFKTGR